MFRLMSFCQRSSLCSSGALVWLLCCVISVSSQSVRNGFIGDDVLLPCIYPGQLPREVNAFWRDRNDKVVLDIINGTPNKMEPKFKGRVFSYPDQYKKGNLSILIKYLRADDAGSYNCYIPRMDYESRLTLRLTGSSQSVRNGFIGDDVLLPCIYPGQLPREVNAFWRDRNDKVVLDIINGTPNKMDPKFKGRVFSYPDQYKKGNLSILIKYLRADDAGSYNCYIPRMDYESRLTLRLTEKPAVKVTSPPTTTTTPASEKPAVTFPPPPPPPPPPTTPASEKPAVTSTTTTTTMTTTTTTTTTMKTTTMKTTTTTTPASEKPAVKTTSPPPAPRDAAVPSSLHPALLSAPLFVLFCSLK